MESSLTTSRLGRALGFSILAAGVLRLAACSTLAPSAQAPAWWDDPHRHDTAYLYFKAEGVSAEGEQAARDDAFQSVQKQLAEYILTTVRAGAGDETLDRSGALDLKKVESFREASGRNGDRWVVWMLGRFPQEEYGKISGRIELGEKLNALFSGARAAATRGDFAAAEKDLRFLVGEYEKALYPGFSSEEAKLLLGDVCRGQKSFLEARHWYENIIAVSSSEGWKEKAAAQVESLPPAPRFWPMKDRWSGRKVALVCAIREGSKCRWFGELANVLTRDCVEADLDYVDVARDLSGRRLAASFDPPVFKDVCPAAQQQEAGVILGVLFDIDPAKRGTTQNTMGVNVPALDTDVKFFVMTTPDCGVLYTGRFKEVAGSHAESRLAERAAGILIRKYLVPACPALRAN